MQFLEEGNHRTHELENDGGTDIGHDSQGEYRRPGEGAADEHVVEAEDGAAGAGEELLQNTRVHTRNGDLPPDPVDEENPNREDDLPPEIGDLETVLKALEQRYFSVVISRLPQYRRLPGSFRSRSSKRRVPAPVRRFSDLRVPAP